MNNTQIKAEAMANVARMHIECGEVLERLSKLLAFSITQDFFALPLGQQKLMKEQARKMEEYLSILLVRVSSILGSLGDLGKIAIPSESEG
jgi:hypothetical protein